jgi:uncharacterized protein (TIGR02271 family)
MMDATSSQAWIGRKLVDRDGTKIGRIDAIYVDDRTGEPTWITVHTGLLATRTNFVPLREARVVGDDLEVPYTKNEVKDAPHIEPGGHLEPAEEQRLFQHYSMDWNDTGQTTTAKRGDGRQRSAADMGMTRSEEELQVGKESVERGRARLRKYVVTEDVKATVPLQREEVRLEREPVTDADRDQVKGGGTISDDQQEVVLHEERPMVSKKVVPKERARLRKEKVTEQRTIADQVRKEQIELDRSGQRAPRR